LTKNVHLVGAQKVLQDLSLHDIQDEFLKEWRAPIVGLKSTQHTSINYTEIDLQ
jgi:hypothetical protein